VRTLAGKPGFTLVIVLTLALGIGGNTAIFTLMDQLLFRLLPVEHADRLVVVDAPGPSSGTMHNHSNTLTPLSHPLYKELRDHSDAFDGVLAEYTSPLHLTVGGQTDQVDGVLVSGTFFEVLGLKAAAGRLFTPADDLTPGGHPIVVLGHGFWKRRFAADPKVVGRELRVNGQPMTVVGIAPEGFNGIDVGESADVYVPLMMLSQVIPTWTRGLNEWRVSWLTVVARLRDGVTREQAAARANVLYSQLLKEDLERIGSRSERFRTAFLNKRLDVIPGGRGVSGLRDQSKKPLLMLMGMVGLVLLIACANVANLLLARASSRQKEVALRLALGATRGRLVRQLLAECLVLSLAGGLLGIGFSAWAADVLLRAVPSEAAARVLSSDPDLRVALFALGLSLLTGVVFGLVPALQSTRPDLAPTLKNESGTLMGGRSFRFRKGLVVAQVALSLLLLIGAGLFTRSLMNLRALDPGFAAESMMTFSVDPALNGYDRDRRYDFFARIQEEIGVEPGVKSVSMADVALMTNSDMSHTVAVKGYESKDGENMNPNFNDVGPRFFTTLGIPMVSGRDFTEADRMDAPKVAIVNETFARYYFGTQDPLGRHFSLGRDNGKDDIEIVGLVKDSRAGSLREERIRFVYVPYTQEGRVGEMTFYVRTTLDPVALRPRMRAIVQRVDPTLPVTALKTMKAQIGESLFVERLVASLSAAFGLLATLLAAVGLYGVMSYAVSLRTREIGIRVALGADRGTVLRLVLGEVAVLAVAGVAIGLPGGYGLGRVVEAQLFGLDARDPLTFGLATVVLLGTALLAGYLPAARAARVQPMVALRYQ